MAAGLLNLSSPMVDAAHARYMQLKQSGMPDQQIFQLMDQEKTLVPLGQLAAKIAALKQDAQQTQMPPQNTINQQVDQQLQAAQMPQQAAPVQAPAPAPQGMAEGGLAGLHVDNVGDEKAYAGGGIVAFNGEDGSDVQNKNSLGAGLNYFAGDNVAVPATSIPSPPPVLANQQGGMGAAPPAGAALTTNPYGAQKVTTKTKVSSTKAVDPSANYFKALDDDIEQRKADLQKPVRSVTDILQEYDDYDKQYGTKEATAQLNKQLDDMEAGVSAREAKLHQLAQAKSGFAMAEQASKYGQAGTGLNKFLAAMAAGGAAYTDAMAANEKDVQASKDKLFTDRLNITKAAIDEKRADLRSAVSEYKSNVTQREKDSESLRQEAIARSRDAADFALRQQQMALTASSSAYRTTQIEKLEQQYAAQRAAGDEPGAARTLETLQNLQTQIKDPTGVLGSKYQAAALQQQLKSAQTKLQYANAGLGGDPAAIQAEINNILQQIQALGSGGAGIASLPTSAAGASGTSSATPQFLGFE